MNDPKPRPGSGRSANRRHLCRFVDGRMEVQGVILRMDLGLFCRTMDEMATCPQKRVVFDFTRCPYLSSLFIGHLVDGVIRARESGKDVEILLSPELGKFFDGAQLFHLLTYQVVDAPGAPA